MHRIISEVRPRYAIIENVPMLTIRGGTRVIADLAEIGMHCEWQIIGADEVGAWHRRKRIWIVAYTKHSTNRTNKRKKRKENKIPKKYRKKGLTRFIGGASSDKEISSKDVSNTNNSRHMDRQTQEQPTEGRLDALCESESGSTHERDVSKKNILDTSGNRRIQEQFHSKAKRKEKKSLSRRYNRTNSTRRNTKKPRGYWNSEQRVGRVANGISNRLDRGYWSREPEGIPRVKTGQTKRVERLRGLGNAIVPQVAYEIMKIIK